jgi:cellulose synthase/poly-beta-1,6-N-acetylglucosamine synthase-like glycosyltransferase
MPRASPLALSGREATSGIPPPAGERFNLAATLYPEIALWAGILDRLAVPSGARLHAAIRARVNGVTFQRELLFSGIVEETAFFRALAEELGIGFAGSIDPDRLILRDRHGFALLRRQANAAPLKLAGGEGVTRIVLATDRLDIVEMRRRLARNPGMAARMLVVAPSALRAALLARMGPRLAKRAVSGLPDRYPQLSARTVLNAWQGFMVGFGGATLAAALLLTPARALFYLHGFFTIFFFACVILRVAAMRSAEPLETSRIKPFAARDLPVYSVLVALYKEAEVVPELLVALGRLQWPRAKLEIKLVCEAGDHETLAAIRAQPLRPSIEIVEVPSIGPRTKPKALAFALPCVSGDFVALYDAEDKPHPLQLLEAWQRFEEVEPDVACVQAPLDVTNGRTGPIARLFAFEYAALFRGILPWLSQSRLLLPLGGTSNHFRRSALDEVVGWDPYNVTEDADLAVRMARFGYRTESIRFPTREEGPQKLGVWLPQRTRWFKGWLLTWLVHMRNPFQLGRQLGFRSFLVFQVLFAGMVVSAIAHPLLLGTGAWIAAKFALGVQLDTRQGLLFLVDAANITCGYASFLLLGWQTLEHRERKGFWKTVAMTPVYWAMMSLAALRAVWQLVRRPHVWEKTPHRRMPAKDAVW